MGTNAEIASHDVSGKLLHCPLIAELRQAGTSRSPWITPEGTRDISGEENATILAVCASFWSPTQYCPAGALW